ncbi:hypothetical protein HGT73_11140 [Rosenbergiella australiborealis]|uniref:Invasion protein IalB n=1 Tax=Rosenbergiella australiborealis TaxID=1544696 RepID=A0ABS5T6C8_9GAMM|nr:invasion associated locus B family protein [Rosenbergiella australiborealis]MBT0727919.1 hypothetical protein [Rosenbergiella australiborealis]
MKKIIFFIIFAAMTSQMALATPKTKHSSFPIKATAGQWTLQCTGQSFDKCILYSQIFDGNNTRSLLVNFKLQSRNSATLYIGTPLDVSLIDNLSLSLADNSPFNVPFVACYKTGCMSQANVDNLSSISSNKIMNISYFSSTPHEIKRFSISLLGIEQLLSILPKK